MTDVASNIAEHSTDPRLAERMRAFYADLDAAIEARAPVCTNRGLCCDFDSYGHDLFVTGVELAYFVAGHAGTWKPVTEARRCPYQIDGCCTARSHRPMGCRVFFCDATSHDWQSAEYERRLAELRRIGSELGIDYRYVEWLSALRDVPKTAVKCVPDEEKTSRSAKIVDPRSLPVIQS